MRSTYLYITAQNCHILGIRDNGKKRFKQKEMAKFNTFGYMKCDHCGVLRFCFIWEQYNSIYTTPRFDVHRVVTTIERAIESLCSKNM